MSDRPDASGRWFGVRYLSVLASAVVCYAALGAVLREMPDYIQHHVGGSALAVGLVIGAPSLTGAILRPLGGRSADRFGPARVLIGGAVVMAAGVLPALLAGLPALVASRLLVGAGEALMMSAAVLWLLTLAGPERRGVALGHVGLANYAGLTIGPLLADGLGVGSAPDRLWLMAAALPLLAVVTTSFLPHPTPDGPARPPDPAGPAGPGAIWRRTLRPGVGLLLVNVGYVSLLSFGAAATRANRLHLASLIVPLFGAGVIASRTLLARVPDRFGGRRTLLAAGLAEAVGLVVLAQARTGALAVAGLIGLSIGQGLAVPALGLLALSSIPAECQGAAAGTFFAYFDAGVGLGGPTVGAVAGVFDAQVALTLAGLAVAGSGPAAGIGAGWRRASRPSDRRTGRRAVAAVGGRSE
jgi:MFS family permease